MRLKINRLTALHYSTAVDM